MPTVIRMQRGGRTHAPYYRIVVMDSRARGRGREVEQLGVYHPVARPAPVIEVDRKKALEWLYKGAQLSDTVRSVLSKKGVLKAFAEGVQPEEMVEVAPPEPEPTVEVTEQVASPEGEGEAESPEAPVEPAEEPADEAPQSEAAPPDGQQEE